MMASNRSTVVGISSFEELFYPFELHRQIVAGDRDIAYIDEGQGKEVLIFIHGLGSYIPAWQLNINQLKQHFRCIAIDLPGYGKSSKDYYPATIPFFADTVVGFMDKLGIDQANVVGHSMGGQIAITTALLYPQKVKSLILSAPAGLETFSDSDRAWMMNIFKHNIVKNLPVSQIKINMQRNFYQLGDHAKKMIKDRLSVTKAKEYGMFTYVVSQSVQGMISGPVFNQLGDISQPVLLLYGENDNYIPNQILHNGLTTAEVAYKGQRQFKNAQLILYPACGHFLQVDRAALFNQAVLSFMEG